jgi:WD40-like Beta Propeller Repeat
MGEVGRRIRLLAGAALIGALTVPTLMVPALAANASPAAYPGSDGRIAFVSKGNIFSILPDGKSLTKLTSLCHASGPRWSPDGAKLA